MSWRTALRVGSNTAKRCLPAHHISTLLGARFNATLAHDDYCQKKIEEFARSFARSKTPCTDIHEHYPGLARTIRWSLSNEPKLTIMTAPQSYVEQIHIMLDTLAASATPADIEAMNNLLKDLPDIFLMQPTPELHTHIVRTFLSHRKNHAATKWLKEMSTKPGGVSPNVEQYHILLNVLMNTESPKVLRNVIRSMRASGCRPTHETYIILIRAEWSYFETTPTRPHLVVFQDIINDMKENGLHTHKSVADLLYDEYASRGYLKDARSVLEAYLGSAPSSWLTPDKEKEIAWTDDLWATALASGLDTALARFSELKTREGASGSRQVLKAVLRGTSSAEDLKRAEAIIGVKATSVHWSLIISNAVRHGGVDRAYAIYEASKEAGIVPDAPLAGPVIKALCNQREKQSFGKAMHIYDDLQAASPNDVYIRKESVRDRSSGPDADVYHHLFRGLSYLTHEKDLDVLQLSDFLLSDAKKRHIPIQYISASLVAIRMRLSETEADAMDAYEKSKSDLSSEGYIHVLSTFVQLTFGDDEHNPSLVNYFRIANDMKAAGHPPMKETIFSILINHLSKVTAMMMKHRTISPDFFHSVTMSVRRLHDLISLEAALDPDAALLNQLMDLYARLGCFGDAYRLWEQMALSGRYDHTSVSIVFDVCGFSGSLHAYRQVRIRLAQENFKLNKNNWDSLVECMCRLRMVNDAAKTVCIEMPGEGVEPDQKTLSPILHVVKGDKEVSSALKKRFQTHLPKVWERLPLNMKHSEII